MSKYRAAADDWIAYHQALGLNGWTPLSDSELFALAQVNATLALVEQQRIANLIALASITGPESEATLTPLEIAAWRALGDAKTGEMLPSIREGLGL